MRRERTEYQGTSDTIVFVYWLPRPLLSPTGCLWSLVGGIMIGLVLAVGLAVADWITVGGDEIAFRLALVAGMLGGAAVLYLWAYLTTVRCCRLQVAFDYVWQRLVIHLPGAPEPSCLIPFVHAAVFRLESPGRRTCALVIDTVAGESKTLATVAQACPATRSGLPDLVSRLNAHLVAIHRQIGQDVTSPQYATPGTSVRPARRGEPRASAPRMEPRPLPQQPRPPRHD
jgi:hypothetical protein